MVVNFHLNHAGQQACCKEEEGRMVVFKRMDATSVSMLGKLSQPPDTVTASLFCE